MVTAILSKAESKAPWVTLQTESGHTARIWGEVQSITMHLDLKQFHLHLTQENNGPTIGFLWADAIKQDDV